MMMMMHLMDLYHDISFDIIDDISISSSMLLLLLLLLCHVVDCWINLVMV